MGAETRERAEAAAVAISDERLQEHLARLALIDGAIREEDRYLDGFVGDEEDGPRGGRRGPGWPCPGSPRLARENVLSRMAEEGMPLGRWVEHGRRALYLRVAPEGSGGAYDVARLGGAGDEPRYELLEVPRSAARRAPAGQDPRVTVEVARLRTVFRLQLTGAAGLSAVYATFAAAGPSPSWVLPALLGGLSLLLAWGTLATLWRLRRLHAVGPHQEGRREGWP